MKTIQSYDSLHLRPWSSFDGQLKKGEYRYQEKYENQIEKKPGNYWGFHC